MLDVIWASSDKIAAKLLDLNLDGSVTVSLGVTFAPAINALIGLYFDKEPVFAHVGANKECTHLGNFHFSAPPLLLRACFSQRQIEFQLACSFSNLRFNITGITSLYFLNFANKSQALFVLVKLFRYVKPCFEAWIHTYI
jgi:hypothetical protein